MELYKPHREGEKRIKLPHLHLKLAAAVIVGTIIFGFMALFLGGMPAYLYHRVEKTGHTIYSSFFGGVPRFISMTIEKNGADYTLKSGDRLNLNYRDEFAVKKVETDSLFTKNITVDVLYNGSSDDFGVLQRGADIIDVMLGSTKKKPKIIVRFDNLTITEIPIEAAIAPQDWFRLAQRSKGEKERIAYLERALSMKSDDVEVRRSLAEMYIQSGAIQKGISAYTEILDKNPVEMNALIELSEVYIREKRYKDAISIYKKITVLNGKDHVAYANMAYAWSRLGNWAQAIRDYENSLMLNPGATDVRYRLAEAYEKQNNEAKAIAEYERLARSSSDSRSAMMKLADHYMKSGVYDKAINNYQGILAHDSRNDTILANLGLAYSGKGMVEKEIESYKKSIAINPRNPVVHYNLALAYEKAGKTKDAEDELKKVLMLKASDPDASEKLSFYYQRRKEYKKAIDLLKRSAKASARADIYMHIARLYCMISDFKNAAYNYELAEQHGANANEIAREMTNVKIKMLQKKYGDQRQ